MKVAQIYAHHGGGGDNSEAGLVRIRLDAHSHQPPADARCSALLRLPTQARSHTQPSAASAAPLVCAVHSHPRHCHSTCRRRLRLRRSLLSPARDALPATPCRASSSARCPAPPGHIHGSSTDHCVVLLRLRTSSERADARRGATRIGWQSIPPPAQQVSSSPLDIAAASALQSEIPLSPLSLPRAVRRASPFLHRICPTPSRRLAATRQHPQPIADRPSSAPARSRCGWLAGWMSASQTNKKKKAASDCGLHGRSVRW